MLKAMADDEDWVNKFCDVCFISNEIRVLQCGHKCCLPCCLVLQDKEKGVVQCPWDGEEDDTEPHSMPTPQTFTKGIIDTYVKGSEKRTFEEMIHMLVECRKKTIQHLKDIAKNLDSHEFNSSISKIAGSVAGIAGSVLAIVGLSLSLTGVGAIAGVPLAITGASVGIAGGVTTGVTGIVEAFLKRKGIKEVDEDLKLDRFRAVQLQVISLRAAEDREFAERWNINSSNLINAVRALPAAVKFSLTTAAGVRMAFAAGQAATRAGLHVAGIVFAAALIPLDLGQMIVSSIRIHKNDPSDIIKDIVRRADDLEKQLRIYFIGEGYFKLVYTNDGYWAYIVVDSLQLNEFNGRSNDGYELAQLKKYGDLIESGKGRVPTKVKEKIQQEWYSLYKEQKSQQLQDAASEDH